MALPFDNRNLRELPVDPKKFVVGESRQVPNAIFSRVELQPVQNPRLVAKSDSALALVGLPSTDDEEQLTQYLAGNMLMPGSEPYAHCYCGHQFGGFAGQLGDGAAMYLGEVVEGGKRLELQLKGAGKTPYSRSSDGRKVLRSSIREFLCSEAVHHLEIPTTRAGSCVTSDSTVERDPFYDGRVIQERCTIVSRIGPNFFRFGSFEIFKSKGSSSWDRAGPSAGNKVLKKQLLDHIIRTYYPQLVSTTPEVINEKTYAAFLAEVVRLTALLVARWQSVGFVHGVLNTDNMSIMGLTIDYGPFAFLEAFDGDFTPNGSDGGARYSYDEQPSMCRWNLERLAEALAPLVPPEEGTRIVSAFDQHYSAAYRELFNGKFGLTDADAELTRGFFACMSAARTDFTDAFRALTAYNEAVTAVLSGAPNEAHETLLRLLVSRSATPEELSGAAKRKMRVHRLQMAPEQIEGLWAALQGPPNQIAEMFGPGADIDAIRDEISGEKKKLDRLVTAATDIKRLEMVSREAQEKRCRDTWAPWVSKYAQRLANEPRSTAAERLSRMQGLNPTFVLRNFIAESCIQAAEKGDFSKTRTVLKMLETPFDPAFCPMSGAFSCARSARAVSPAEMEFLSPPPAWAASLLCTCSS